ncbi:integrator complex subunit 7 isoform X1 [Sipha flava]|jgi:integrator complex subunit 7|uniref:Integrator complex subunit 7 n=1 Tax=Sipha flava TaxID=143950 RepID=A0A2S2QNF0_9HEMI|nr:integrator complex subunit 7 isoform X1 [Sipha flava]
MPSLRNTICETLLGEPDQDANSALIELDKGLRSIRAGEQCEAIVRFPRLIEKYPFPILINSSFLKLADVFRLGSNFLRFWVLQVCQQTEKHIDKILNIDEFVRRIYSVIHSNDPVARGLTLRTLGSVARIIPERGQVHHSIRTSLDSHNSVEVESAIYAAAQFAAQSKSFAVSMCSKISNMIQGISTDVVMKLELIPILKHMHHDTTTATMVRTLCTDLLEKYPAQDFVLVTLKTLNQLALSILVDVPKQIELLLKYLSEDKRPLVCKCAISGLYQIAKEGAHFWSEQTINTLVNICENFNVDNNLKADAINIFVPLIKSPAICQFHYSTVSPLMKMCIAESSSLHQSVAGNAIKVLTNIACYGFEEDILSESDIDTLKVCIQSYLLSVLSTGHTHDNGLEGLSIEERLFIKNTLKSDNIDEVVDVDGTPVNYDKSSYYLRDGLRSSVLLCKANKNLIPDFVSLVVKPLQQDGSELNPLICEAIAAFGGILPGTLQQFLPIFLKRLTDLNKNRDQESVSTTILLCTVIFQAIAGYEEHEDVKQVIKDTIKNTDLWSNYKIGRAAVRYGHFSISSTIFGSLNNRVSSEQMHFWLAALETISTAESQLASSNPSKLLDNLGKSISTYYKAIAALKAASLMLIFQTEYTRLRCELLQCFMRLLSTCNSFCTTPPPAIASAIVQATRDEMQSYGHITNQLRKRAKEFKGCADLYWRLYQSAFDADPNTLYHLQLLQHLCLLMAHSIETVAVSNKCECPVLDSELEKEGSLEIQLIVKCRQELLEIMSTVKEKAITHKHIRSLKKQASLLATTPMCFPRYFFQTLQSTTITLAVSPQPRVNGEPITVNMGSNFVVKVEGVVQHGTKAKFRKVDGIQLTIMSHLITRNHDARQTEGNLMLTQTVKPHKDFFASEFCLSFNQGSQHQVHIEAALIDDAASVWQIGVRSTLTIKCH